eukprot:7556716-Pyramimonas_sp.AAC.1
MFPSCCLFLRKLPLFPQEIASGRALLSEEGVIEMRRCARSGRLIVLLDQFDPEHVAESIRPLHITHLADSHQPCCGASAGRAAPPAFAAPPAVVDHSCDDGITCVPAPVDHSSGDEDVRVAAVAAGA